MAQQTIETGSVANDGTGDPLRTAWIKANANFTELYSVKANLASPTFTGTPLAPTAADGTNTTQIATTGFVQAAIALIKNGVSSAFDTLAEIATELGLKAPLASPTFTGTPAAPTAAAGTNTTQLATTAFVRTAQTVPCFRATKGVTNQTNVADSTTTQVTFGTEDYDIGSHFASNVWTPPAGKVSLTAKVRLTGTIAADATFVVVITKNGATSAFAQMTAGATTNEASSMVTVEDVANGTDAYGVAVFIDVSSGTATITAGNEHTYFCGHWFSP